MNVSRLTRTVISATIALAVCLLVAPAIAKDQITRPVKILGGNLTITVDPATGAYVFTDWGVSSHTGRYTNTGSGVVNLATGEFLSGTGVVVAANGDTITWKIGTTPNTVVYTGGTGRFEGATGGFPATITSQTLLSSNADGTVTLAITYEGEGTINY